MPDGTYNSTVETCDLCIIGAGIAGLNALFVATQYLSQSQRIILIDRRPDAGGMWNDVYGYVRLHQPHEMFTVGNLKWTLSKPRSYLAKRDEVQAHLRRCLDETAKGRAVTTYFDTDVISQAEINTNDGPKVQIASQSTVHGAKTILADRLIDARGFDNIPLPPKQLSSGEVKSTSPELMFSDGSLNDDAPAFIIGGGKTAMDTILALISQNPTRKLTLINGQGTAFVNRDNSFPTGFRRMHEGKLAIRSFGDISSRFDGTNEDAVAAYFRNSYAVSLDGQGGNFLYAIMSEYERDVIKSGLSEIVGDYLEDVIDTKAGPQIRLRSGQIRDVPHNTVIISCTGNFFRRDATVIPTLSPKGRIVCISMRDAIHVQSSVGAYFLTHLFFRGIISDVPLYLLDNVALLDHSKKAWHMASASQAFLNSVLLIDALPTKVALDCGLDFDRWFPLHRRLAALIDIKVNHRRYVTHATASLDVVHDRFNLPKRLLTTV